MAGIFVEIDSDIRKLQKIKAEIENVKKALKGVNVKVDIDIAKGMEAQLKSLMSQYDALVKKISEAEGKIMLSTKRINDASDKILKAQERFSKAAGVDTQSGGGNANAAANNAETASIQAQAKAYDELKGEIESVIGTRSQNIKRMVQEQNAIRLIQAEIKQINKTQGQSAVLSRSQQQRLEQLNNSLLTHKTALAEVRQSLNSNAKLDNAATTSMNGLSQSLSRMRQTYRELTEEERRSPFGKELLASINQADAKIRQLDASIGNHQRNIGNYASSWNGLDISIQQIGRELPSLAYGARTFFSAISNNIPILVDEIKRAKVQYDELKNSGQKAVPVWKQVVSSIFSWQTALTVGITLLTLYGDKVVDWVDGLFRAKEALSNSELEIQSVNNAMKEGQQNVQNEINRLNFLYRAAMDENRSRNERKQAINELRRLYPDYLKNLSDESIMAGKANDTYMKLTKSIIEASIAKSKMAEVDKLSTRALDLSMKAAGKLMEIRKAESETDYIDPFSGEIIKSADRVAHLKKEYEGLTKELRDVYSAQIAITKGIKVSDVTTDTGLEVKDINAYTDQLHRISELRRKGSRERIRLEVDLENQVEQARIDAMKDGFNKEQAQRELNNKKELQAIERQKQDYINKVVDIQRQIFDAEEKAKSSKDKSYKMQTFDASSVSVDTSVFDTLYEYVLEKQKQTPIKQQEEAWNEYLIKYGTFLQKKEAITKEYNDKIAKATTEGDKRMLQKEMAEVIQNIDLSELKKGMNWEQVFGNLDKVSTDTLKKLKANLKDFISSQKDLSPENLKELVDAIERIDEKVSERNPFEAMTISFKSLKNATDAQREAQEAYNKALKEGTDEEKKNAKSTLESAKNNKQKALSEATTALHKGVEEIGQYVDAGNQVIGIMETLGVKTPEWLEGTMSGFGEMLNGLERIDLTKPMSIVTGGLQTVKGALTSVISLGGLIPGLGGADYSGYEKMKAQYEHLITIWDELINKKMEYIDINYGTEAMKAAEEAEQLVNIQISRQRQLIKQLASSGASIGSHSLGYRIAERLSPEDFKRISDLAGEKITAEWQLWDLSSEKIEKILTDEKLVSVLDTVNKDFVTYLQNIADYGDQLTEIAEKEKEAITGMSFDEFKNGYADLLSDLDSTNEDFADNFEKHLQNAIFKSLIANEYKDKIKELYDTWAKYGEDGLSDNEVQQLRDMQQQLADSLLIERDKLMNAFGWDTDIERTQQSPTMGYSVAASQDSVDVLNGQLNAQRIGVEEIKQQNINQSQSLNLLTAKTDAVLSVDIETRNIADETRDLIAQSYLELVQISENTGNSAKYLKEIKADIAEVKKNTSNL